VDQSNPFDRQQLRGGNLITSEIDYKNTVHSSTLLVKKGDYLRETATISRLVYGRFCLFAHGESTLQTAEKEPYIYANICVFMTRRKI
jgi:hypothetical protein